MTPVPCGSGGASAVEANAQASTTNKATTRCRIGKRAREQRRFTGNAHASPECIPLVSTKLPRKEVPRPDTCRTYRSDERAMDQIFAPGAKAVVCRMLGLKMPVYSRRNG